VHRVVRRAQHPRIRHDTLHLVSGLVRHRFANRASFPPSASDVATAPNSFTLPANTSIEQALAQHANNNQGPVTPPLTGTCNQFQLLGNNTRSSPNVLLQGSRQTAPLAMAFDLQALSRIPSYNTAVRSPYIAPASDLDGLPSYDFACGLAVGTAPPAALATPLPPTPPADVDAFGNPLSRQPSTEEATSPPPTAMDLPRSPRPTQTTPPQQQQSSRAGIPGYQWYNNAQQPSGAENHASPSPSPSSQLSPPRAAHLRNSSYTANEAQNAQNAPTSERQGVAVRPTVMGAGSLAGLWSEMRRGST
jgi:hypothetical protein